ncbi:MAG: AAA family ATPase, partial [Bernardetiaceae bacterium]|nr:AAA family ATPase [Bernardetiaceae bacterium]
MTSASLLLSTGEQDFAELRSKKMLYVDKTAFIHKLVFVRKSKFNFIARPRRFGKSLLVSLLKNLFEGRRELFEGLFIYDKIDWQPHPVIHLDFSRIGFKDIGLTPAIDRRLNAIAASYKVELRETGIGLKFAELMERLHRQCGRQVAVLIDEYDKPITEVLEVANNQQAYLHRDILRQLYSVVKGSSEHICFFFMTGVARFAKVSAFSDLNNLTDLTFSDWFHNMLGYTQEEIERYFAVHLEEIAKRQGISREGLLGQVRYWYDGFSWNGVERVYNPYSVLRFLEEGKFMNFWFDTGTPKFLVEMLKDKMVYDFSGVVIDPIETENMHLDKLSYLTLLFQTGYLTIREVDAVGSLVLDYPNQEVAQAMTAHLLSGFSDNPGGASLGRNMVRAVMHNDLPLMMETVNGLFSCIPHQLFDSRQERYFHAILFLALKLCGFLIESEVSV